MEEEEKLGIEASKLRKNLDEVLDKIRNLRHDELMAKKMHFIGKYYKDVDEYHPECHRLFFVYGVDNDCRLKTLEILYWEDCSDTAFSIQYNGYFEPDGDDANKIVEVTKEEFVKEYNIVNSLINRVVKQ